MLPNLIIIGARKAGTSSLYNYLGQHPEITVSRQKELRFFIARDNWSRGLDWYEAQFGDASTPICAEASPQYTTYPRNRGIPERMHSVVPDAKLIYLVRDPIERLLSHYMTELAEGRESRELEEALLPPSASPYVAESSYRMQLEPFLAHYPLDRVLVLQQEALLNERWATIRRAFSFLGVDPAFDSPRFDSIHNPSSRVRRLDAPSWLPGRVKPQGTSRIPWRVRARAKRILYAPFLRKVERPVLDEGLREQLVSHLQPDADGFRELTGLELPEWSTS